MKATKAIMIILLISLVVTGCVQDKANTAKEKIKDVTSLAHESISFFYNLQKTKVLSEVKAQERAISLIDTFRYGSDKLDFFFIFNTDLKMVMHPYVKRLVGRDLSGLNDVEGKPIFKAMKQVCEHSGEGFVDYMWQYRDHKERIITKKIAFVKLFKPWNWIIGTSVYLID